MEQTRLKRPEFVLGTVQLGIAYGAANATGLPSETDALAIIHRAVEEGVRTFDTARAYGDSERRLGIGLAGNDSIKVITKLTPELASTDAPFREAVASAARSLETSRACLQRDLQTVLLHRAAHRTAFGGAVWDFLRESRSKGRVGRLGVSVQSPAELLACVDDPEVEHIQLPFNILDHRWQSTGCIEKLLARSDICVHTRSVFLQGLLAAPETAEWPSTETDTPGAIIARVRIAAEDLGFDGIPELALAFVRAQSWIDGIVIGVETLEQLDTNLCRSRRTIPNRRSLACTAPPATVSDILLDPARWPPRPTR